jgi:hypothetical protein
MMAMSSRVATATIVVAWVVGLGIIAWSTALASSDGRILLLAWGLLPPFLVTHLRKQHEKTLSESIREALL